MWETQIQPLGWKHPLEKVMTTLSSILAHIIPWTKETHGLQAMESKRVGHNCKTNTNTFTGRNTIKNTNTWRLINTFLNNQDITEKNQRENFKISWSLWQWKHDNLKPMRFCKHSGKREVCSNISLLQETRDPSKKQSNLIHKASRKKYKKSQKNLKINGTEILKISSVQFSSVAQSCLIFCDPMNRRTPSLPVHHQLPEFTQTRVHQVSAEQI